MASEVIEKLLESEDAVDIELAEALLRWQDDKASKGLSRSLGYEPREIREKGAVAIIEDRVLKSASGFEEIEREASYEAIVDRHPERFRDEVVAAARKRLSNSSAGETQITSEDVDLIASSRGKSRYADLAEQEHAAYARVSNALKALGDLAQEQLKNSVKFEVRTTSGFSIKSGIRGYIPKDLWFSVSPRENANELAGMPQLFMIVSERGIEYGFGASVSPTDFSQAAVKKAVRKAAPIIFQKLPKPGSAEAKLIESNIELSGGWFFRRKHRLPAKKGDFASIHEWLDYLHSAEGIKNAAGTISRYLKPEEVDQVPLNQVVIQMTKLFEPLLDREWSAPPNSKEEREINFESKPKEAEEVDLSASYGFAESLSEFLTVFDRKRAGPFAVDGELGAAMKELKTWLENCSAVASRPTVKVKVSVGQGGWTKTPWIALLDSRETTSTQRGRYVVFLVAEDLSTTYLTLNQGMTDLVNRLKQTGAIAEMHRVAHSARQALPELSAWGFIKDNDIDLRSDTTASKNYEEGTIAYIELPSAALPSDEVINGYLDSLLWSYDKLISDALSEPELGPQPSEAVEPFSVEDALEDLFLDRQMFENYLSIWKHKKNIILQGAPGVGKSFIARRLAYSLIGLKDDRKVRAVQFHQSYSYEDFVQGYRPNGELGFELKNGAFYCFRDRAIQDPDHAYVFIIDEINRGNLSKIFGELMLLIEPDKRGPTWKTRLAYAGDTDPDFFVPENLYILGMMNTADRSLSLVDYALRRRFAFVAMEPLFDTPKFRSHLLDNAVPDEIINKIVSRMGELNQAIENDRVNLGPGFRVGHSFFTPTENINDPEEWYARVIETEIYPLLAEYWFDSPETADSWRDQLLGQ